MSTPLRTQYIFDSSGYKYKTRADLLRLQRQWETFERVENYNDIVYQKIATGDRGTLYYQFRTHEEYTDYRNGQELHVLKFPTLPTGTFASISERPMPDVPVIVKAPVYTMAPATDAKSVPASVAAAATNDMTIYMYVSSYNVAHVYKYNFVSDDERLAYHRAERRILTSTVGFQI
jgi:hypothetical protein